MSNPSHIPVLDPSVIDRLRTLEESGEPTLVDELIRDFGQLTPHRLGTLRDLARGGDLFALSAEADALAESCGTLGLEQMRRACVELAHTAREEDATALPVKLAMVERGFIAAHEALEGLGIAAAAS